MNEQDKGKLWRGLDEFAGSPAYTDGARDEFPEGAGEFTDEPSRRRFIELMGASLALAGAAGCIRPASQRKIIPYVDAPDEVTPGVPNFYATAYPLSGYGHGVLARSSEGRPTKIEGNPDHPGSLGGTGLHAQASTLDLYDPDRSRTVTHRGLPSSYEAAVAAIRAKLFTGNNNPNANLKIRVLTETVTSPTLAAQMAAFLGAFPNARWVQYDAVGGNAKAGLTKALGKPVSVVYDFLKADVVLSLDSDVLSCGPGAARYARDFADRRKIRHDGKDRAALDAGRTPGKPFAEGVKFDPKAKLEDALVNRLYAIECMPTTTGSVADHRLAFTTAQIGAFVNTLAAKLGVEKAVAAGSWSESQAKWLEALAADLQAKKGKSIIVAGEHLPAWVHTLVAAINAKLDNVGKTVKYVAPIEARVDGKTGDGKDKTSTDLKELAGELAAKSVDVLLVLGCGSNPVHTAAPDTGFSAALEAFGKDKSKFSLHLGTHQDETGVLCEWHINEAHYLEAWGDIRGYDGTVTIQQPLIAPLHNGKSAIEVLATLLRPAEATAPGSPRDPLDIVVATWSGDEIKKAFPGYAPAKPFKPFWDAAVQRGVVPGTAAVEEKVGLAADWSSDLSAATGVAVGQNEWELNFRPCPALYDGRFANNGWLQELPKPITKISWDNAAFVSPKTAEKLGAKVDFPWTAGPHGRAEVRIVSLSVKVKLADGKEETRTVKVPVWPLPGHADNAITVHLGHGRERAGRVAGVSDQHKGSEKNTDGKPVHGFDAYPLRATASTWATAATVQPAAGKYFLACTQGHWAMAQKDLFSEKMLDRKAVRFASLAEYAKNPMFAKIPPMAYGETDLIVENTPHPKRKKHDHDHGEHDHDHRLVPLNMYNPEPTKALAPGLPTSQWRRWAMAIDLSVCNGCSACVVACQSENNTPVVGKEQVTKGREMYWINIDRYYTGLEGGDPSAVTAYFQPRMCVQCENAPCEIVCPVGATVHSADGLNDMAYNRCVGTRYCSNNCPYKVRRFNFLTFQDWETDTLKLGRNPDVSVRSRGVMEKCTFCVQRIRGAEIVAEREHGRGIRPTPDPIEGKNPKTGKTDNWSLIKDGEVLTACQAACPSGAIVFGDINDPDAAVSRWKNEPTNYGLLAEINTRPRLTYTAVVRNPNPAIK
jgi:molybdopterin-containing oxidoreductase family iron-sulfur binding subunit